MAFNIISYQFSQRQYKTIDSTIIATTVLAHSIAADTLPEGTHATSSIQKLSRYYMAASLPLSLIYCNIAFTSAIYRFLSFLLVLAGAVATYSLIELSAPTYAIICFIVAKPPELLPPTHSLEFSAPSYAFHSIHWSLYYLLTLRFSAPTYAFTFLRSCHSLLFLFALNSLELLLPTPSFGTLLC